MTLCAGTCTFLGTGCRIGLSEPLLKLRPVEDLYSTLLHEMIHAYLFLTEGVAVRDGPDGHGPKFMSHAHRISEIEGLPITPYHTFTDEVEVYRTHHWRCDKCAMLIKRAMNRAPAPSDPFWSSHQRCCGGAFVKVAEPPKKQKPLRVPKNGAVAVGRGPAPKGAVRTMPIDKMLSQPPPKPPKKFVPCPVCNDTVEHHSLNAHLDKCLEQSMFTQAPPGSQPNSVPSKSKSNPVPDFRNHENPGNVVVIDDNPSSDTTRRDPSRARQARVKVSPPLRNARRTPPVAITPRRYLSAFQKHAQSFMNFAVKPNSETAKPVMDSLKLPTSPLPTPPEQPVDVVHILRPLIGPETPFDEEQRIRAKVNPSDQDFSFRETAKRLGTTAEELFQNVFANSRITPDGRRELSAEVIDLISPVSEPPRHRERDSSAYNRKRPGSAISFSNKKHKIDAPSPNFTDSPNRACPSEPMSSRGRETPSQLSLGKCPLCDKDVPRSQLQSHINTCLTDSDIAPYIFSDDETEPDPNKRETPKLQSTPGMGNVGDAPRCPICDKEMPREDLESHVATCMASMGLVDEF